MRINEIINESETLDEITRPNKIHDAGHILKHAGYEKLGYGMFADVYAKPGADHVLKLFDRRDRSYPKFVNMVIQHPNNHFPKFKGKIMKITDNYYAIRMEMLSKFSTWMADNGGLDLLYLLQNYIYGYAAHGAGFETSSERASSTVKQINDLEKTQPGIKKACEFIADLIKSGDPGLDLHNENLMMRGNTIVFTDPVSH